MLESIYEKSRVYQKYSLFPRKDGIKSMDMASSNLVCFVIVICGKLLAKKVQTGQLREVQRCHGAGAGKKSCKGDRTELVLRAVAIK